MNIKCDHQRILWWHYSSVQSRPITVFVRALMYGIVCSCFFNAAFQDLKWQHYRIWRVIGTELGIDVDILNSIEKDHRNDQDRLHALVDSANPLLTHEMISKVLQSERVSNAVKGLYN